MLPFTIDKQLQVPVVCGITLHVKPLVLQMPVLHQQATACNPVPEIEEGDVKKIEFLNLQV